MDKITHYVYTLFCILAISCTGKQERMQEVLSIKEMGELATTEYHITKIIKASDDQTWYKVGDRKILLSVDATLKAGVDLSSIGPENIQIQGHSIHLVLPPSKLISLNIPPGKIRVAYEEIGVFRNGFTNAERDALLAQGERQIKAAVKETGILETTENSTRLYLTGFLRNLGFTEIAIHFNTTTVKSLKP